MHSAFIIQNEGITRQHGIIAIDVWVKLMPFIELYKYLVICDSSIQSATAIILNIDLEKYQMAF